MSIYRRAQMTDAVGGMATDGKARFISTFVGLICYFVAIDLINLVRIPLRRKIRDTFLSIKSKRAERKGSNELDAF